MDVVITYVNGMDPLWQKDYVEYTNTPILEKRFRDWGTLRYLMRGIAVNMPFIRKVHLIVARDSQVPEWVNREQVNVVLHKDIIPEEFLPTFNSTPIEMHLHRIKDLDEEYMYFNDDIFPMLPCKKSDFFSDGKCYLGMSHHLFAFDMFKKICRNSDHFARKLLNRNNKLFFLRPQHVCTPMLKSECEALYNLAEDEIRRTSASRTRTAENLNQYLFLDYMNYKGLVINEKISNKHFSVSVASPAKLRSFLKNPDTDLVCINDVKLSESRYESLRDAVLEAFDSVFPEKSKYEI